MDLGIIIDNRLTWKFHINYISTKIAKSTGVILKARKLFNKDSLLMLYHALVYPYLTYCIHVWGSAYDTHKDRLVILQKKIVRIISGVPPLSHTAPLFMELKLLKLDELYFYSVSQFMYKYHLKWLPDIIDMFIVNSDVHGYRTRQASHFHIPHCKTNISKMFIKYQGSVSWNNLSSCIDVNCSIGVFKNRVKQFLFDSRDQ